MVEGSRGVALSNSKTIRWESYGLIVPKVESRDFRWVGYAYKTSGTDIVDGDSAK